MRHIGERAVRDVMAVRDGHYEKISIGVSQAFVVPISQQIPPALRREFPRTHFEVNYGPTEQHGASILAGKVDIALTGEIPELDRPELDVTKLGLIEHGVVAWPGTLPGTDPDLPMPLSGLADIQWVLVIGVRMENNLRRLFYELGIVPPEIAIRTNSFQMAKDFVRQSGRIMSSPLTDMEELRSLGFDMRRTDPPLWQVGSCAVRLRSNRDHPLLERLLELSRSVAVA